MSYVLATNFLDRIDGAVQRGGRFDEKCGIYPPDIVSRFGRLLTQLRRPLLKKALDDAKEDQRLSEQARTAAPALQGNLLKDLSDSRKQRIKLERQVPQLILKVLNDTGSGPMTKLGRPGWYSAPRGAKDLDRTPFGYILSGPKIDATGRELETEYKAGIEPEALYEAEKAKDQELRTKRTGGKKYKYSQAETLYWEQWEYIDEWDRQFKKLSKNSSLAELKEKQLDKMIKESKQELAIRKSSR